jgi:hypothetical protein
MAYDFVTIMLSKIKTHIVTVFCDLHGFQDDDTQLGSKATGLWVTLECPE